MGLVALGHAEDIGVGIGLLKGQLAHRRLTGGLWLCLGGWECFPLKSLGRGRASLVWWAVLGSHDFSV